MKKILSYFKVLMVFTLIISAISCSDEKLDENSVIKKPNVTQNAFDIWLYNNYTLPYNIDFKYKMEDIETSTSRVLVPAEYTKAVAIAKLVKHLCTDAYGEVSNEAFIRLYFPKVLHLTGSAAWLSNGSRVLGEAEGGRKITLFEINELDPTNIEALNEYYFKTIHHEFSHILHQTKDYSPVYKDITGTDYLSDSWDDPSATSQNVWLPKGFISAYARKEPDEDFVEMIAHYLVYNNTWWNAMLTAANITASGNNRTGKTILEEKLTIVKDYMFKTWNVDLDVLKATIQRRQGEIGKLNLYDL
ncbi:MAG: putative zinc-binding metallopeptidase [Prevotellaceae bacterium]|jgi:substrate import-associated zinc metallohydrolase lipoprotein|nr:putative zinc-binding metallopeptidase [Prevotellaceae bacterium]